MLSHSVLCLLLDRFRGEGPLLAESASSPQYDERLRTENCLVKKFDFLKIEPYRQLWAVISPK
jgi:hypothetical protein